MFTDCRLPMKTPLFPLAVIAALLLSLPARADGKAGEAAANSVQKNKEKESIEQPTTVNPNKLPFPISIDAPADLAALLREHLSIINRQTEPDADIDQEQMQFLAEEAPDEIKQIVRSQGYFSADIQVAPHGRGWRITVKPGPRTQVSNVEVSIVGKVLEDAELANYYKRAMANWALPVGQPFVNSEWSSSKDSVLSAVRRYKYPLASLTESRATINPQTSQAVLSVSVDSKQPVYFGDIQVSGNERYPASVITGMAQFKPGEPYDFDKILDYQQALEQDSHYSRAQVEADFSKMVDDHVPLLVSVSEVPRQKFDIGLRYDSKDGPGIRLGYEHYNVFNRGYVFAGATDVNRYEKSASIGLSQPRNSNGWYWTGNIAYNSSTTQKLDKNTLQSGIWRVRDRDGIEARFGLEYITESRHVVGGPDFGRSNVLMLTAAWRRQNIETLLRPANGYYLEGKVGATVGSLGSSAVVQRVHGRAGYYFTPEEHKNIGTFIARGELGYTHSNQDLEVPSVLLFRSGGANSVRGYEQDSIGLKGPNNSVLPDRALAVASFEYQKPIGKNFALALFHDMGSVSHNFTNMNWHHGSGVGLRWFSPIAPFSFDLAYGHQDRKLRWHISLGTRF
ncbi:outer membrane protein assembly factor YaeT [Eikenella corrodens]|uniref:Outer membrane protein assembly factor YaeT n=2 Tax=Eikenella corrodens TaxID=539 RepID=A0A8B4G3Q1_EIKCO|nr:outer membrane protein assembly factor YaeT [Eikenella corrodens]